MSKKICGVIPWGQESIVGHRDDGYLAECLQSSGHIGPHILCTPEGKYFAWQDDEKCGCCAPEQSDRCYDFWPVSKAAAEKLLVRK